MLRGCTAPKLIKIEREMLKCINWDFENFPNFFTIVELFRSQGVFYSSDRVFNPHYQSYDMVSENTLLLADKYIEFFSLLCLQDNNLIIENPYLLSCAIIAASR